MIEIKGLSFSYAEHETLNNIHLSGKAGQVTGIIGPNGSGKSTLLKCMAGILVPRAGAIRFNRKLLTRYKKKSIARMISYLPQKINFSGPLTVFEVILLGRYPSLSWRVGDNDLAAVDNILKELGIQGLAPRDIHELSGGEKQMVFIAQALVRDPMALLLDEPVNHLDLRYQFMLFELLKKITEQKAICTFVVLHDINLAATYSDHMVVLNNGEIMASGSPAVILTSDLIESVYGVKAHVYQNGDHTPQITLIRSDTAQPN